MYLIVIAWIYVVLMMAVAEATNTNGTVLGAVVTFLLYGVGPAGLVAYLMGAPARGKRNKKRLAQAEVDFAQKASAELSSAEPSSADLSSADLSSTAPSSAEPDAGSHAASGSEAVAPHASVAPVRKEH